MVWSTQGREFESHLTTDLVAGVVKAHGGFLLEGNLLVVVHAAALQGPLSDADSGCPEFPPLLERGQTPGFFQLLLASLPLGLLALGVGQPVKTKAKG